MSKSTSPPETAPRQLYGQDLAANFGAEDAPFLITRSLKRSELAVTEINVIRPNGRMSDPLPRQDGYVITCNLHDLPNLVRWRDDHGHMEFPVRAGESTIDDLRRGTSALIDKPIHALLWILPRSLLNALADEINASRIDELRDEPEALSDETLMHMSMCLLPALRRPQEVSCLFADHVMLAFATHAAHTYGGMQTPRLAKGGLAPWQERRSKEMLVADLTGDVPLAEIAAACGLSVSHFSRAFRGTTGFAPHAWLLQARVERAMTLLRQRDQTLSEIAVACGFVDRSHFTRVFVRRVGLTPGSWRRVATS
jgi:AraC-like DNA-binding protein